MARVIDANPHEVAPSPGATMAARRVRGTKTMIAVIFEFTPVEGRFAD